MSATRSVPISETLFAQVEALAQRLKISSGDLVTLVIGRFVANEPAPTPLDDWAAESVPVAPAILENPAEIHQGAVYWAPLAEPGAVHPYVVIQADVLNHSRINTVVVCALTSNLKRASLPGNVLLEAGEANLPRPSVVEVSKVSAVDKTQLGEYIGSLTRERIHQILAGMQFLQSLADARETEKVKHG
jgi:mRNA interferase MazF